MVGIRSAGKVLLVAAVAVGEQGPRVIVVRVALCALDSLVGPGQREGRLIVVKCRLRPRHGAVTLRAVGRKS